MAHQAVFYGENRFNFWLFSVQPILVLQYKEASLYYTVLVLLSTDLVHLLHATVD